MNRLLARGADLYAAAVEALDHTYKLSFDYAYSKQTTATALLDVSFDFGANPALREALAERRPPATSPACFPARDEPRRPGVTFHEAALTHHVQRQAHVRVSLPFFTRETARRTSALGRYEIRGEDGEVYFCALDATNEMVRKGRWESRLSVGLGLEARAGEGIRRHDRGRRGRGVRLPLRPGRARPADDTARTPDGAPVRRLLPRRVRGRVGRRRPALGERVGHRARQDRRRPRGGGGRPDRRLARRAARQPARARSCSSGSTPRRAGGTPSTWTCRAGSRPSCGGSSRCSTFSTPRTTPISKSAYTLLVYASLPVTTSIRVVNRTIELNDNRNLYWNWPDDSTSGDRHALIFSEATERKLEATMGEVVRILASVPRLRKHARHYDPRRVGAARSAAVGEFGRRGPQEPRDRRVRPHQVGGAGRPAHGRVPDRRRPRRRP